MPSTNHCYTKMHGQLRSSHSGTKLKSSRKKSFTLDIATRIARFLETKRVEVLHPSATCIGNIVSIPSIPWSTFCRIQRLIERPELQSVRSWKVYSVLQSVRHWKVCFDLPRPLLTNQSLRHCRGTLSYKMPSSTHELLAQFASELRTKMWDEGSQDSFYPPDVRHEKYFINNSGSADLFLRQNGNFISKKQPDGGLQILNAEYPFLVLEIAHSETEKHALRKAKDYIRYSQGKIIYVIVVSVHHSNNHDPISAEVDSDGLSAAECGKSVSTSPLSSLECSTPTAPSELDKRYGVTPAATFDAKADAPSIDSSAMLRRPTASDSVGQSLSQGPESFTYGAQDSLKVWVFKRALLDDPNPANLSGLKLDASPIIECAEVFPKKPRQEDLCFDILWNELSKKPNEYPDKKFTVQLDLLHQLAKSVFIQDTSTKEDYDIDRLEYPVADTQTTQNSNRTSSQISSSSFSESSHSADPSYGC